MTRLIQLGDIHLCADPDALIRGHSPQQRFNAAIRAIARERCDYLLLAGDVSDDGSVESYQRVIDACNSLGCEWGWIPGNHDVPDVMSSLRPVMERKTFTERALIGLNSWVEGWDGGEVGQSQLERLKIQLDNTMLPVLLAVHHPPLEALPAWMRKIGLRDQNQLIQLLDEHSAPAVVLSGHIHHPVVRVRNGVQVMTSPGCIDQFSLDHDDFHTDDVPPGFLSIILDGEQVHSEVRRFSLCDV